MINTLKENWAVVVLAVIAILAVAFFGIKAKAAPSAITFETTASTTTLPAYVGNGTATTTYQLDSNLASSGKVPNVITIDAASLYLLVVASSSATTYAISPQFSNNNIDWYGVASTSGATSGFGSSATVYTWTPGTTATTTLVFNLPAIPAAHERVQVSASGAAGSVYMEADLKKNPSTP